MDVSATTVNVPRAIHESASDRVFMLGMVV